MWSCSSSGGSGKTESSNYSDRDTMAGETSLHLYGKEYKPGTILIDTGVIKSNQLLPEILAPYGISNERLLILLDRSEDAFDVRRMRAGKTYFVLIPSDSATSKSATFFVYKESPSQFIVFDFSGEQDTIYRFEKPIEVKMRVAQGIIDRTLYHTIIDMQAPMELGLSLAEVYAWQVDFFRIQKYDKFKVYYEEQFIEGESVGIGMIKAACFIHRSDTFYAYRYEQDSAHQYFDQQGKSLRKAFLKAPLRYSRISSRYTKRRFHPVQKRWKAHLGTDYAAPTGTPIRSVGDGTVINRGYTAGNGNYVKIKHNSMYTTQYLHMSRFAPVSRVGNRVRQGDVIGYVGSTGLATGPHLCFRFWKNGQQVDPFSVKIPPSTPVKEENRPEFEQVRDSFTRILDEVQWQEIAPENREA